MPVPSFDGSVQFGTLRLCVCAVKREMRTRKPQRRRDADKSKTAIFRSEGRATTASRQLLLRVVIEFLFLWRFFFVAALLLVFAVLFLVFLFVAQNANASPEQFIVHSFFTGLFVILFRLFFLDV